MKSYSDLIEDTTKKLFHENLYVSRPLSNAHQLRQWALSQGFSRTLKPENMHVTIAYSRDPVRFFKPDNDKVVVIGGKRKIEKLGEQGAVVLVFESEVLMKHWKDFIELGASWDYENYKPHVTISYEGSPSNLKNIIPFGGDLVFGPEKVEQIDTDWKGMEEHI